MASNMPASSRTRCGLFLASRLGVEGGNSSAIRPGEPGSLPKEVAWMKYEKPSLIRFGSFREVTRGGGRAWALDFAASTWREFLLHRTPTTS